MFKRLLAARLVLMAATAFAAVDVNKATAADLDGIKGIGPGISAKILDERKKGNFKDWNDLVERVKGIGEGNAAKFSAEGMTVNGSGFKGAAAAPTAKKEDKPTAAAAPAAPAAKKEDKPMAAAAPVAPAAKKDDKPMAAPAAAATTTAAAPAAAAKPAADKKADAKADMKAEAKSDKKEAKAKAADAASAPKK